MFCLSMNVKITFNIFNFHFNNFLKQVFYKSYRSNLFLSIKEQLSFKTPIATVRSQRVCFHMLLKSRREKWAGQEKDALETEKNDLMSTYNYLTSLVFLVVLPQFFRKHATPNLLPSPEI